jgi:F-type H+-transporting ATPase subunit a
MQEHPLLIVDLVNAVLGPPVRAALEPMGFHFDAAHPVIPNYLVMVLLIVAGLTALCLFVRSRLSVENPGKLQILLEDGLRALLGMMEQWIGPKGPRYFPLVATLFVFILVGNYLGLVPGFMAPTSNLNVTLGCALTIWVYYHFQGIKEQGFLTYLKHFALPPGAPVFMAPLMFLIEIISHLARVMSLSLRLFGNIFGEELVILIFFSLVPFVLPLPMMFLALITGGLQAFIFALLSIIYLQGAVAVEHAHDEHEAHHHGAPPGHAAAAA